MPTYEYRCEKCGHEFEREQRITEEPVKKCPSCRAPRAKRLISATSFVLKGGGWYSDLYSSAKGKSGAAESSESKAPTADAATPTQGTDKAASSGDAKPASGGKRKSAKTAAA
ncbi:MAG: zinc ribbon domain-containing protein [Deltaproteobacteria bacterium]|nr:zinc ribbon domain-containing protein [Deltaproteobacteria bacterium]